MNSNGNSAVVERLLVTIDQVAHMLGVSSRHLRRMMARQGFIAPVRIGGAVRFEHADVLRFIEEQKGKGGS